MLRRCFLFFSTLHSPTIHSVSGEFNELLSARGSTKEDNSIKDYIRSHVIPILEGSKFDGILKPELVKRDLCIICRDAAYAAALLKAKPNGSYVKKLLNFIRLDNSRMDFVKRLSAGQVSKIIEYLTYVGIEECDLDCLSILFSCLNFRNLRSVSRVMFSLVERGYGDLVLTSLVPCYTGERWLPNNESSANPYPPGPEAVRCLRALSKASRSYLEARNPSAVESELVGDVHFHWSSFHLFRNRLVEFIFTSGAALRCGHWVNCSRALLSYPPVLQRLHQLNVTEFFPLTSSTGTQSQKSGSLTCTDLAEVAIAKVFQHVESVEKARVRDSLEKLSEMESKEKCSKENNSNAKQNEKLTKSLSINLVKETFDCNPVDLLKLFHQLSGLPLSPVNKARIEKLFTFLARSASELSFANIVKLLGSARALIDFPVIHSSIPELARTGGRKLLQRPVKETLMREHFSDIARFSVMIYAYRLKEMPEFLIFLRNSVVHISPHELTLDYVMSLLNSLSIMNTKKSDSDLILSLVNKVIENVADEFPLLASHPEHSTKFFRAFALQSVTPPMYFLKAVFGEEGVPNLSSRCSTAGGGITLFDISRSLTYAVKRSREVHREDIETFCWDVGMRATVLPLLNECTVIMQNTPARKDYIPVSWRTTMEALGYYCDVSLDHHSLSNSAKRISSVYDLVKEILQNATISTGRQIDALMSLSAKGRKDRLRILPFKNNTMIHFLSALLSWEYYLFTTEYKSQQQANRSKRQAYLHSSSEKNGEQLEEREENELSKLVEDYQKNFLFKRVKHISGVSYSPMEIVEKIFTSVSSSSQEQGDAGQQPFLSLIDREKILEITTHLPFSIALVLSSGPVSDYFMEKSFPTMLSPVETKL